MAFSGTSNNTLMVDQFPQPAQYMYNKQIVNVPQLRTTKVTEQDILTMPIVFYENPSGAHFQKQIVKSKF